MPQENTEYEDYAENDEIEIDEYDITASPNDFNVLTIYNFIESGAVKIPGFQRNYVWDISRASKLIESLILGIPVPQIFLYEMTRNEFLVIDGQQRLMSIYYFIKKRFPKKDKRAELRVIYDQLGKVPDDILDNDEYFENFRLKLSESSNNNQNKFKGLSYTSLGTYKTQFDMRVIRNVIIKQNAPEGDDSAMYEVFNRLNTGGINLKPQEIRTSMYHSLFYEMLNRENSSEIWRKLLVNKNPDIHMKDVEILLRGFAMLIEGDKYSPSMVKFLNNFSKNMKKKSPQDVDFLDRLLNSFLNSAKNISDGAFLNKSNRFNVALFESVFATVCKKPYQEHRTIQKEIDESKLKMLEQDSVFSSTLQEGTTQSKNITARLKRAEEILGSY